MTALRRGPEPRSWTLTLPFTKPLSLNDRTASWQRWYRLTKPWRDTAIVLARKHRLPPLEHFTVVLHYAPRLHRTRDAPNLEAVVKPLVDGLVKAGIAPGDDPRYYTPTTPEIHPATGEPGRLWLVVKELPLPEGTTP